MYSERFEPRGTVGGATADPRLQRASDTSSTRRQVTPGVTSESYAPSMASDPTERSGRTSPDPASGARAMLARHPFSSRPLADAHVEGRGIGGQALVVLVLSPEDLRAVVREAVRAELTDSTTVSAGAPLVDRHEVARLLGVSAATITRMTAEGMPHVFAGASPRYAPEEVRAWLAARGRKGTKTKGSKATVAGVRLLSRAPR
jgi:hypothetical protein